MAQREAPQLSPADGYPCNPIDEWPDQVEVDRGEAPAHFFPVQRLND